MFNGIVTEYSVSIAEETDFVEYNTNNDHVTELCVAAYSGDKLRLKALLSDPTYRDKINHCINLQNKHSALFFACYGAADAETVRLLLEAGADPLQRDSAGFMPLHFAARSLDAEVVAVLLENPDTRALKHDAANETVQTPLHALFIPGSGLGPTVKSKNANLTKCLPYFLERDKNPLAALHAQNKSGVSALMMVKRLGLRDAFTPYVPSAKAFEIYLNKSVHVPGNIDNLIAESSFAYAPIPSVEYVYHTAAAPKMRK